VYTLPSLKYQFESGTLALSPMLKAGVPQCPRPNAQRMVSMCQKMTQFLPMMHPSVVQLQQLSICQLPFTI
jgi:hypothetical protein